MVLDHCWWCFIVSACLCVRRYIYFVHNLPVHHLFLYMCLFFGTRACVCASLVCLQACWSCFSAVWCQHCHGGASRGEDLDEERGMLRFSFCSSYFLFIYFSQYYIIACLCVSVRVGLWVREREREGRGITVAENLLMDDEWTMRLRRHIREQGGSFCATGFLCRMTDLRCPLLHDTGRAWENVMLTRNIVK